MPDLISKSYQFRVYPTLAQRQQLDVDFFASRWVYNRSLDLISRAYADRQERITWVDVSRLLTAFKQRPGSDFLRQASNDVLTQALRNLDRAFTNFFQNLKAGRKPGYPKPKNRYSRQSARYTFDRRSAGKVADWNAGHLCLPKLGILKVHWSQDVPTMPKMVTVSKDSAGRYFVSMAIEEPAKPLPITTGAVGVDVGIKTLAQLSDGTPTRTRNTAMPWQCDCGATSDPSRAGRKAVIGGRFCATRLPGSTPASPIAAVTPCIRPVPGSYARTRSSPPNP